MTARPIMFSGPMVHAMLCGRKTQTRRLAASRLARCKPGDLLWVKETWGYETITREGDSQPIKYRACYSGSGVKPWKSSLYMPRWASRLTLEVTQVEIERLQDISDEDAQAEGVVHRDRGPSHPGWTVPGALDFHYDTPSQAYEELWGTIHNLGNEWSDNPLVVALTFKVHRCNVDRLDEPLQECK